MQLRAFARAPNKPKIFDASKSKYAQIIDQPTRIDASAPGYLRDERQRINFVSKDYEKRNPEDVKAEEAVKRERLAVQKVKDQRQFDQFSKHKTF